MALGAQRLYKAITNGQCGIVQLYLSSQSKGDYHIYKIYELIEQCGFPPDMLDVILSYAEFQSTGYHYSRRGKTNFTNSEFKFASKIIVKMEGILHQDELTDQDWHWCNRVMATMVRNNIDLIGNGNGSVVARCIAHVVKGSPDIYELLALNKSMALRVAVHNNMQPIRRKEVLEWYQIKFGIPTQAELTQDHIEPFIRDKIDDSKLDELVTLMPDPAVRENVLRTHQSTINNIISFHRTYEKLAVIAPWIAGEIVPEVVKLQEGDDE